MDLLGQAVEGDLVELSHDVRTRQGLVGLADCHHRGDDRVCRVVGLRRVRARGNALGVVLEACGERLVGGRGPNLGARARQVRAVRVRLGGCL